MNVGDIVHFEQANFFEGAVQLRWLTERPAQAQQAAQAFVFHGPRYHAAADAQSEGFDQQYRLKDTASFLSDLLSSLQAGLQGEEQNPYWLAIAGYGAGKSHLALTCASLLSDPHSELSHIITQHLSQADETLGQQVKTQLAQLQRSVLVLTLDGMSGFHLGNALTQAAITQLQLHGSDIGAIAALSPRFQTAEQFVERNYTLRLERFNTLLPNLAKDQIFAALQQQDETVYNAVDKIYHEANGSPIPVVGQESAQDLLATLCEVYCGPEGQFSSVVILFDEFGRYLEYAAEKPLLAGDAALQQIFQGVQDNSQKIRFIGFIQYELKAYLKRFGSSDLRQLQRYITRFDAAQKSYLSSNLETLFAHMISKQQHALDAVWQATDADKNAEQTRQLLQVALPAYQRQPVWMDKTSFNRVIAQGCWPLHPLATWFLTRQRDVVQSRSALTFIKETLERSAHHPAQHNHQLFQVSAAELVLEGLLPEMIAAERETGSSVAETLQTLLEKFQAHLNPVQQRVLAGVAILERMRINRLAQSQMNQLLAQACVIATNELDRSLEYLSQELGALEWNQDLGQYELIADASTRGQFQQWLRQQQAQLAQSRVGDLFISRTGMEAELTALTPTPDFAQAHEISTPDWQFKTYLAHAGTLKNTVERAFKAWQEAQLPTDPKGQVIYCYMGAEDDTATIEAQLQNYFKQGLERTGVAQAPIWVIGLPDTNSGIAEHLGKLYIFQERLNASDKERFARFVPDEHGRSQEALKELITTAIRAQLFWVAGFTEAPKGRLKQVADRIFENIYPQAMPFCFDGFGTANGTGAIDSALLTRSLILKQVNAAWFSAQQVRVKNRTLSFLTNWGCLRTSSSQITAPTQANVKIAYDFLVKRHQNPTCTLEESRRLLIAPPYGLNNASAGLLLALVIGLEPPPRRLIYRAQLITANEWLNLAFPAQKGSHYFHSDSLAATTIRFLDMNAEGRWRDLLTRWESAEAYADIIKLSAEVERQLQSEPLPESLQALYFQLKERALQVEERLIEAKEKLDQLEKELELAVKKQDTGFLLKNTYELAKLKRSFEPESLWPSKLIEPANQLYNIAYRALMPLLPDWIPRQLCNTIHQVEAYRHRMQKIANSLKKLDLLTFATQIESQAQDSIANIEKRQKFSLLLDRSQEYPQQPHPTASTTLRVLQDELQQGNELIHGLKQTESVLKPDEIKLRIQQIQQRQKLLTDQIQKHKAKLAEIYNNPAQSQQDLTQQLIHLEQLQEIFLNTADAQEVRDLIFQLHSIQRDLSVWEKGLELSVETFTETLHAQVKAQIPQLIDRLEAQDIEAAWDLETIYRQLMQERLNLAQQRSTDWLALRVNLAKDLNSWSLERCLEFAQDLENRPLYLSHEHRFKAQNLLEQLQIRVSHLREQKQAQLVDTWLKKIQTMPDIAELSRQELENWLKIIQSPPSAIQPKDMIALRILEEKLLTQLDQLSLDDMMNRINRLPLGVKRQLYELLQDALQLADHD